MIGLMYNNLTYIRSVRYYIVKAHIEFPVNGKKDRLKYEMTEN